MVVEKRKERRIKARIPIKIVYPALSTTERNHIARKGGVYKNNPVVGKTENLSRLGTYVEIDRQIPAGSDIDITLQIPDYQKDPSLSGKVGCKGTVFRCDLAREAGSRKYYGIGIFFTDFFKNIERNKLSEYIDSLILNEEKGIKEGLKKWRKKRNTAKASKQPQQIQIRQKAFQREALNLLKQILNRLEEIDRLLKSKTPP